MTRADDPEAAAAAAETFDPSWLALREPVDHRSRAAGLLPVLEHAWRARGWSRVVDLGAGTGSNLRYLSVRLPAPQAWTLVDHDAELLSRVTAPAGGPGGVRPRVRPLRGDLAREGLGAVADANLVTASALLDLVGEPWLDRLVDTCRAAQAGALFALSYDGVVEWADPDPDDALVRDALNAHQQRDKGLGRALGPAATATGERLFRAAGFRTRVLPSPWQLGPGDTVLAIALLSGWERAACEQQPGDAERVAAWAERRRNAIARGWFGLLVGHLDLLALPPEPQ